MDHFDKITWQRAFDINREDVLGFVNYTLEQKADHTRYTIENIFYLAGYCVVIVAERGYGYPFIRGLIEARAEKLKELK